MDNSKQKRFCTFLLASGQRIKITPPAGTNWSLNMIRFISGIKPNSIINEILTTDPEEPIKNNFITFDENEPDCRIMSIRLSNKDPFQCYLRKKKSYVHFVFSSNSKEKLLVEQVNKETFSIGLSRDQNFPNIFMNEIQRIVKSEHPLNILSSFFKKYEIRPYFHVHAASFDKILSDSVNLALIKITEKVISEEISHYINFLDLQIFLGEELYLHDALIIEKIVNLFPRLKPKVNHIVIHTKNFLTFICLLIDKNLFDFSFFYYHFSIPENVDIMIVFKILKVIVDDQIPICSSMLKLFLPYVDQPLLYMLLSPNKILYDSTVISKQISNVPTPVIEPVKLAINQPLKYDFIIDEKSVVEKASPAKTTTERNIPNFNPQSFSPQKINDRKKLQISTISEIFEMTQKKPKQQLKIMRQDHLFLEQSVEIDDQQSDNHVKVKGHHERSSKQNMDTIIIASCSLFALVTVIFIWTHFSFYAL